MTYAAYEGSQFLGAPVELYVFQYGVDQVWRYTSSAQDIEIDSVMYLAHPIIRDSFRQSLGESIVYGMSLTVPRNNPIANLFLPEAPKTSISVRIYRYHQDDPDRQIILEFVGVITSAPRTNDDAKLSVVSLSEAMRRKLPWQMYQSQCNYALYSAGCGVNKEQYVVESTVLAVVDDQVSSAQFGTFSDGYFTAGYIQRLNGDVRYVVNHTGTDVFLTSPFVGLIGGEVVKAYPGCMRTEADCRIRYGNLNNHLGWSRIPVVNPFEKDAFGVS